MHRHRDYVGKCRWVSFKLLEGIDDVDRLAPVAQCQFISKFTPPAIYRRLGHIAGLPGFTSALDHTLQLSFRQHHEEAWR